ncbi:hypothetical protein G3N55_06000 [Dissulfurirhabdus thermomarina]|uniref:Threonyl-tRNA synthetase editing domain-containing protein n=1 Tax=Dissulfurirhabdus thermomarina TaxID=1765737 RepID=A0A6N9TRL0_DISTH|nr:threonyl-tRNA synthetase editing domain-containing protein [Dissulfurirhabdus thermomarina]NDY42394.1 hypothetical protein [Dissulfurirhabdus thermomarina]NMX23236.1 hypothetical protein [Dissulfurirhabdus thermomarina]
MRLLLFFAREFHFTPFQKTLDSAPDAAGGETWTDAVVVFYHCEARDPGRERSLVTKAVKNIKWLAGKFGSRRAVLHSFAHLASDKAEPDFSRALAAKIRERLEGAGFEVAETPFGYLNEWRLHVAGESLAKVFKEL